MSKKKRQNAVAGRKEQIRALSIRQPYVEQIFRGVKTIEYRSRNSNIRGTIYIYASLGMGDLAQIEEDADSLGMTVGKFKALPRGVLIGTVEMVDSIEGDYRYEWHLENPVRFKNPLKPNPEEHPQPVWFYPFGRPGGSAVSKSKKKKRKARKPKRKNHEIARERMIDHEPVQFARKSIIEYGLVLKRKEVLGGNLGEIILGGDDPTTRVLYEPRGTNYGYSAMELRAIADEMDRIFDLDEDKPIPISFEGPIKA